MKKSKIDLSDVMKEAEKLALDHWKYIEDLLITHKIKRNIIDIIRFHYITAFIHGWKHGRKAAELSKIAKGLEQCLDLPTQKQK